MYRLARHSDYPAIAALMNRAYRGEGGVPGWTSEEAYVAGARTSEALLRADLAARPGASLLAWVNADSSDLSGCVLLEPQGEGGWYLGSFAVDPLRQNSGQGRTMLAAAEDWVRAHGGTSVRMTVINVRVPLIDWYIRRGYVPTGEQAPFPYHDPYLGTPLRDDLAFVVLGKDLAPA